MSQKLEDLLNAGRALNAEYKNGLMSSHLPMALIALSEMGAGDDLLDSFDTLYRRRLKPKAPSENKIDHSNWKTYLGQHALNADYVDFFEQEIAQQGFDKTLETYLPDLMPGISGGAFHPLIRLAYALDVQHEGEVAEALAAWALAYQELPAPSQQASQQKAESFQKVLEKLSQDKDIQQINVQGQNIAEKIKTVVESPAFEFYQNSLDLTETKLDDVCDAMVQIFGETRDFTILHGLTSASALRKVLPYLDDKTQEEALTHYGDAVLAAYVTVGAPALTPSSLEDTDKKWSEIFNKIVTSKNDHAVKVIYTCHQEAQRHPQKKIYKKVANAVAFPKTK